MRLTVAIFFLMLSSFGIYGQDIPDIKLDNLKGAIKYMFVLRSNGDGTKEKDVIGYRENGFLMLKHNYDTPTNGYVSFEEDMEQKLSAAYTVYTEGVRYVHLYDNNRKWEDQDHAIEIWAKEGNLLISSRKNSREKWEIRCMYKDGKLTEKWEKESINYRGYLAEIERTSTFEYDEKGDIKRELVDEDVNGIKNRYVLTYDIRSRDNIGNILLQTKRNSETANVITEEFVYVYYK